MLIVRAFYYLLKQGDRSVGEDAQSLQVLHCAAKQLTFIKCYHWNQFPREVEDERHNSSAIFWALAAVALCLYFIWIIKEKVQTLRTVSSFRHTDTH